MQNCLFISFRVFISSFTFRAPLPDRLLSGITAFEIIIHYEAGQREITRLVFLEELTQAGTGQVPAGLLQPSRQRQVGHRHLRQELPAQFPEVGLSLRGTRL